MLNKVNPMKNIISHVPAHLSKVLYIPRHNAEIAHFAVYDITQQYADKLGSIPMGSEDYKVELCLLRKPGGCHVGDDARFLVNSDSSGLFSIQERCIGRQPLEGNISRSDDDTNNILIHNTKGEVVERIFLESSYPLPEKKTKKQLIRYPYLNMSSESANSETQLSGLEWQVHPIEAGPLRYELVDPEQRRQGNGDSSILAIYHHHGFENDLPTSYSHGVLLLPSNSSPLLEITVVSGLLVLLSTRVSNSYFNPFRYPVLWLNDHRTTWRRLLFALCRGIRGSIIGLFGLFEKVDKLAPSLSHEVIRSHERWRHEVNSLCKPLIREDAHKHTPRQTESCNDNRDSPLHAIEAIGVDVENTVADEDDGDLQADHDHVDEDEEPVSVDSDKDVKLIVEATTVELVEDLHPHEDVEDDSVELELFALDAEVVVEDGAASEVQNEDDDELEDRLTDDHLPHLRLSELGTFHDNAIGVDTALGGDGTGGDEVVSCDHTSDDSCTASVLNSEGNTRADGVLDTDDAEEGQVAEVLEVWDFIKVLVGHTDCTERLARKCSDGFLSGTAIQDINLSSRGVDLCRAIPEHNLRSTLDEQLDKGDLLVGSGLGEGLHAEVVFGKLQQGGLCLGADEYTSRITHSLTSSKHSNEVILLQQPRRSKRQRKGNSKRQTLWYSHSDDGNGYDQEINKCRGLLLRWSRIAWEVGAEAEEEDEEHEDGSATTELGDGYCQAFEFLLERC
ncbi:hypothetical protein HG530_013802 [Fusarium avenaceum]|nr:hypothetical protein HG530_013802 [Fusarium avenaceum]